MLCGVDELVIEPAIQLPSTLDRSERWQIHGRLILRAEGLYFIHGWDVKGHDLWRLLDATIDRLVRGAPEAHAGAQMLADYADRTPEEQAQIIPDSRVILDADIASASVHGLAPKLVVETQRLGDRLIFRIPRWARDGARSWASAR